MNTVIRLDGRATVYFLLRRIPLWTVLCMWLAAMFGGVLSFARDALPGSGAGILAFLMFFAPLVGLDALACSLRARSYAIELRPEGIAVRSGVLRTLHETLLYGKVQDILITRNIFERLLGVATMVIQNAGGTPQSIPALRAEDAGALRDAILRHSVGAA